MTTIESVLIAARRKLLASTGFTNLLNVDVGKDAMGGIWDDAWLFRGYGPNHAPMRDPSNTGLASITMTIKRPLSTATTQYNTMAFRLLEFDILADMSRQQADPSLSKSYDADLRCDRIATVIKEVFNDVANDDHDWPNNTYIVSCVLYDDLYLTDIPNKDGLVEGTLSFAVSLG